jgi:hypothetical protein
VGWWAAGGYDATQDTGDSDKMPDAFEDASTVADGGPFNKAIVDTFVGDWVNTDIERNCIVTELAWVKDSADGEDWAKPGSQWP